MTEQEWITTSTGPGFTLGEICEDLDLDIEDLAQDHIIEDLHGSTEGLTRIEKMQEDLYDAFAYDNLLEVYSTPSEGPIEFLGLAKAKDIDIYKSSTDCLYQFEALLESGQAISGSADDFEILESGC